MDTHVKERLTGAVILVVLIVLVVPELLRGPRSSAPAGAQPAAVEGTPVRSYRVDLTGRGGAVERLAPPEAAAAPGEAPAGGTSPAAPVPGATPPAATAPSSGAATSSTPVPAPSPQPGPGTAAAKPQPEAPRPAPLSTESPRAAQPMSAQTTPAPAPSPAATGAAPTPTAPAASPAPASAAKPPLPGSAASQPAATAHGAAGGGSWAIQVGSFSARENADRLVRQLEAKGFKAYVSKTGTGAKQMFRVRVGPVPNRAAVDALAQKLRAAGRAGTVVAPGG